MQQKQRGQALLPVEGQKNAAFHFSVNEVEHERPVFGQRLFQRRHEALPDTALIAPALGIVALNDGNGDVMILKQLVKRHAVHDGIPP